MFRQSCHRGAKILIDTRAASKITGCATQDTSASHGRSQADNEDRASGIALTAGIVINATAFAGYEVAIEFSSGARCWTYKGQPGLKTFIGEFHGSDAAVPADAAERAAGGKAAGSGAISIFDPGAAGHPQSFFRAPLSVETSGILRRAGQAGSGEKGRETRSTGRCAQQPSRGVARSCSRSGGRGTARSGARRRRAAGGSGRTRSAASTRSRPGRRVPRCRPGRVCRRRAGLRRTGGRRGGGCRQGDGPVRIGKAGAGDAAGSRGGSGLRRGRWHQRHQKWQHKNQRCEDAAHDTSAGFLLICCGAEQRSEAPASETAQQHYALTPLSRSRFGQFFPSDRVNLARSAATLAAHRSGGHGRGCGRGTGKGCRRPVRAPRRDAGSRRSRRP